VILLVLAILTSFTFGQLWKWSQRQGCHAALVVTVNYLVVALLTAVYLLWQGGIELSPVVWKVGLVTGCTFILSMTLMTWALTVSDVATILTAFRLSIVVPIVGSVILWQEDVSPTQLAGIALALSALLLMSGGARAITGGALFRHGGLALAVCSMQGISHTSARWVHYAGLDDRHMEVLLVTAATAGLLGAAALTILRRPVNWPSLRMGIGIGVFNVAALAIFLAALARFQSAQFFPVSGCAVVIMDSIFAHLVWRERLSVLTAIGAVIGAGSILLVL
jgi:drug/metabolite transporter (DMT)-like permease